MIEWSAGWEHCFCPTIWSWGQWQAPILEKSLETCCRGGGHFGKMQFDAQQKLCCRFWVAPAADPFAWSKWWPPGMWKAPSLAYSKWLTTAHPWQLGWSWTSWGRETLLQVQYGNFAGVNWHSAWKNNIEHRKPLVLYGWPWSLSIS